ncbi:uncharacterized protein LOC120428120 [Culex pipiens pallens]|uniref:uncharacterized protein LOC120428120 n=1 Tax=Culex pipiens pallens TaxID=42434 RepID=UPI0022AB20BE|nr:uncharacterized protein LOC120428120 [Culex pipiens pallens]
MGSKPNSSSETPSKEGDAGAGQGRVVEKDKTSFLQELQLFQDRNGSSRMNLDSEPENLSFSKEDEGLINPMFRMRFQDRELPVQTVLKKVGNVTILFSTLLSRVETSIRNRPDWGLRKRPVEYRKNRYSLDYDVGQH